MKNSSVNTALLKRNNLRNAFKALALVTLSAPITIGGQAVIEGVMMRSPKAMAIAVRRADGGISIKEERWHSLSERLTFLRWPFIRGTVVLVEALINGIQALNFSAHEALVGLGEGDSEGGQGLSAWTLALTMFFSAVVGLCLFLVIPHLISGFLLMTWGIGGGVRSFAFHLLDGFIKMAIFIGYVLLISRMADIKRIFEYHGAEHKAIYNYEAGEELCPANAKRYSTLHPRCGTAFIMVVLLISIGVFAAFIPMIPFNGSKWLAVGQTILVKIFLMFPIAGAAYEITRLAAKDSMKGLIAPLVYPGLLMQTITTSNPTDDQLEVAIEALKRALKIEKESTC